MYWHRLPIFARRKLCPIVIDPVAGRYLAPMSSLVTAKVTEMDSAMGWEKVMEMDSVMGWEKVTLKAKAWHKYFLHTYNQPVVAIAGNTVGTLD